MAATTSTTLSPQEIVAREARDRVRFAPLALLAGFFTLLGGIVLQIFAGKVTDTGVLDVLHDATSKLTATSPSVLRVLSFHDHASLYVVSSLVTGSAAVLFIAPVFALQRAYTARRPESPGWVGYLAIVAGVGTLISGAGTSIDAKSRADDFAAHPVYTVEAVYHALRNNPPPVLAYLGLFCGLALATTFVLVSLNAMRVGLLTRFMGILGIIAGVLFVVPLGGNVPIVQTFWLMALAVLLTGKWPGPSGVPPAWESGKAEPWPSNQQAREQRAAAAAARKKDETKAERKQERGTAPPPDPDAPLPKPHSASKKRQGSRKRRK